MRGSKRFCQRGSKFDFFLYFFLFFQLMNGERIKIPLFLGHNGPLDPHMRLTVNTLNESRAIT